MGAKEERGFLPVGTAYLERHCLDFQVLVHRKRPRLGQTSLFGLGKQILYVITWAVDDHPS